MKKEYVEPKIETVLIKIEDRVLFHSDFESGGENSGWDWNDGDDD